LLGVATPPTGDYLVRAATRTASGWDVSACGALRLPSGRVVVAVAALAQSSTQAGDTVLTDFFAHLSALAS
jgi:hypothetical protein